MVAIALALTAIGCTHVAPPAPPKTAAEVSTIPWRLVHFVLRGIPRERADRLVELAAHHGFNGVIVLVSDGVSLRSAPWTPGRGAWSPEEFHAWAEGARQRGLVVIPEFKFLTHQEKFFQRNRPQWMYNELTWDPRRPEVYEAACAVLDEVLPLLQPPAVHIGHDELAGYNIAAEKRLRARGASPLPAELFLEDVRRLHRELKARGVETWMWADMLLSPSEFPTMFPRTLHGGNLPGYGAPLRRQLPRDIVLCTWHYHDQQPEFPVFDVLRGEGFCVLGATWQHETTIRNMSRAAATSGISGMIATTWFLMQRGEMDAIERILEISGREFPTSRPLPRR